MKKGLRIAALLALLGTPLMAEVVFDLGAQQFSNAAAGKYIYSTYDTGKSIASTGLAEVDGYYRPKEYRSGSFGVKIKEPKGKWSVAFGIYAYIDGGGGGGTGSGMALISKSGQAISISIGYNYISVNGEKKTGDIGYAQNINGSIQMSEDKAIVHIDTQKGSYSFEVDMPGFKLEQFNISLFSDSSNISYTDKLNSLTISADE